MLLLVHSPVPALLAPHWLTPEATPSSRSAHLHDALHVALTMMDESEVCTEGVCYTDCVKVEDWQDQEKDCQT